MFQSINIKEETNRLFFNRHLEHTSLDNMRFTNRNKIDSIFKERTPVSNSKINDIRYLSTFELFGGEGIYPGYGKTFPYFEKPIIDIQTSVGKLLDISNTLIYKYMSSMTRMTVAGKLFIQLDYETQDKIEEHYDLSINDGINELLGFCTYEITSERDYESIILLKMKNIANVAKAYGYNPYELLIIVYINELAHYLYFNGDVLFGQNFFPYHVINSHAIAYSVVFKIKFFGTIEFHEIFAQLLTYKIIKKDEKLLKLFMKFQENQPPVYKLWEKYKDFSDEQIHDVILNSNSKNIRKKSLFDKT